MRVVAPSHFTHHWCALYAPVYFIDHWYAPYVHVHLRVFTLINRPLARLCLVLLQIPFCTSVFAQKSFNKVRNDHEHTQRCEFLVLDQKHPFWANLTQQMKIVSLSWNLVSRPVRPYRIQSWCFFCFRPKIPFLV